MDKYYSVTEICDALKLDSKPVYAAVQTGDLKASKLGKTWRVAESDLYAWIEKHSNQQADKED